MSPGSTRLSESSSHTPTETSQQGEATSQSGDKTSQLEKTTEPQGEITNQQGEITCQEEELVKSPAKTVCNVGTKLSLTEYAEKEWRGSTPRAELMKKVSLKFLFWVKYLNYWCTVKILKFGTPQTIAIIVLKIEKFDVTLH